MNSMACSRFKNPRGHQADGVVGGGGRMLVSFFFLDDVDVEIGVFRVLAHDHAFVYFRAGCDGRFRRAPEG